ncbi:MAG: hypothetical protein HGB17_11285, partial [Syntrophobacteraceae bacterium]|nr:hypothetical protein [Syntrophobacteraceae bacterium]
MIRYSLVAVDTSGRQTRSPAFPDPIRSPQYHGTVVDDPVLTNSRLPVLHWFIQNPGAADITVHAVYYLKEGTPQEKDYPVPAGRRSTVLVNSAAVG